MEFKVYSIPKQDTVVDTFKSNILQVANIRYDLIKQVILWQQSKKRSIIAHTKEVSTVSGSGRKISKQKGTGRARHGSIKRSLFRGGAITFGPTNKKNYIFKINKKVKKSALIHALAHKLQTDSLKIVDSLQIPDCKSSSFIRIFKNIMLLKTLFIDEVLQDNFCKSIANIHNINALAVSGLNVLDIVSHKFLYCTNNAFQKIIKRLHVQCE